VSRKREPDFDARTARPRLPVQKIHPHDTALLIIDMERDFLDEGPFKRRRERALIPTINQLSAWARAARVPVIFTLEMHRADRSDYGIELEYDRTGLDCSRGHRVGRMRRSLAGPEARDYDHRKRAYEPLRHTRGHETRDSRLSSRSRSHFDRPVHLERKSTGTRAPGPRRELVDGRDERSSAGVSERPPHPGSRAPLSMMAARGRAGGSSGRAVGDERFAHQSGSRFPRHGHPIRATFRPGFLARSLPRHVPAEGRERRGPETFRTLVR